MRRGEKPAPIIDRSFIQERMRLTVALVANPPSFEIGDLIIGNPLIYGDAANREAQDAGQYPLLVVLNISPSWHDVAARLGVEAPELHPECQAIFTGQVDSAGEFQMRWVGAWSFTKAPASFLAPSPSTSLNN